MPVATSKAEERAAPLGFAPPPAGFHTAVIVAVAPGDMAETTTPDPACLTLRVAAMATALADVARATSKDALTEAIATPET